jgi:hypothetical protein
MKTKMSAPDILWTTPLYEFLRQCNATRQKKTILDCGAGYSNPDRPPLLFLFILLAVPIMLFAGRLNVLELYNALPESMITKYTIKKGADPDTFWFAVPDMDDYEEYDIFVPCIVDIKNGYIRINDEGTGGGSRYVQEIVLFRSGDGIPYIGISAYSGELLIRTQYGNEKGEKETPFLEYEAIIGCNLTFLMLRNDEFIDVTEDIFPRIRLADFFTENPDRELNAIMDLAVDSLLPDESLISYSLPREGFIVKANLNVDRLKILAPALLQDLQYQEIHLKWDKQEARFCFIANQR